MKVFNSGPEARISGMVCPARRATSAAFCGRRTHSAMRAAGSMLRSFWSSSRGLRNSPAMKPPRASPMRSLLRGMIAVCGIGRPKGRRNRAVTANQSAQAPTADASAKAAT
jgi:hypothetical protein